MTNKETEKPIGEIQSAFILRKANLQLLCFKKMLVLI